MAEVLVRLTDAPAEEGPMKHRAGFAAVVMPDGHPWGERERPPTFVVVRLPNVSVEKAREVLASIEEDAEGNATFRRKARIPPALVNSWAGMGRYVTYDFVTDEMLDSWVEKRDSRTGRWR